MNFEHYKVIFFASSEFSIPSLEAVKNEKWNIVALITQPDKPKGRELRLSPTPAKEWALAHQVKFLQFESLKSNIAVETIASLRADFAVVISYGKIIPPGVLNKTRLGFLNIHPSKLPKYRGPSPVQSVILNGEKQTAVSIILMDEVLDHGPVVAQEVVDIESDVDYQKLHDLLAHIAAQSLINTLRPWVLGKIKAKPQDEKAATFTKILTKEDGRVNWKNPAERILRQLRALRVWPGIWTILEGKRVKIADARVTDQTFAATPGQISAGRGRLYVNCGNQSVLEITSLQLEGKNLLSAADFLNGFHSVAGKIFE